MVDAAILANTSLFQDLDPGRLESLKRFALRKAYPDGATILKQGKRGAYFGVLLEGQADVVKDLGTEKQMVLARLSPGDHFGEMAVLENSVRAASVVARGTAECVFLPEYDFLATLRANPEIAIKLLVRLSRRVRELDQVLARSVLRLRCFSATRLEAGIGDSRHSRTLRCR